jgi:chromosome partitioning protein
MILPMTLSERTPVKRAINNRKCVWKGARGGSHQEGAREWKAATNHILTAMGAI